MKIISQGQTADGPVDVQIEVRLWPGLPDIKITGLPDQHIKESAIRVRSALKAQGFTTPISRQILVNLQPAHLKKSSPALELAIAAAILWESEQIPKPEDLSEVHLSGVLSLDGQVHPDPEGTNLQTPAPALFIGPANPVCQDKVRFWKISQLRDLSEIPQSFTESFLPREIQRPEIPNYLLSAREARLLEILSLTRMNALLAGPAGSGKSTLAQLLHCLLPTPTASEVDKIESRWNWRPLIAPHHTIPPISFIGGGSQIHGGEIQRAHGGILHLDELLEFKAACLEALREPMEKGVMRISRGAKSKEIPLNFQVLATTNLCPCGDLVPSKPKPYCRFSLTRCRSTMQKLSGPLLDRFQILFFTETSPARNIPLLEVLENLETVWARKMDSAEPLNLEIPKLVKADLSLLTASARRRNAILRTAQAIAMLDERATIDLQDYKEALSWAHHPFIQLQRFESSPG